MTYTQLSLIEAETTATSLLTERREQPSIFIPPGYTHGIYEYPSRGMTYYRYIVNVGHDNILSRHLPGGNTMNPIAQKRQSLIQSYIDSGKHPTEILRVIDSWQVANRKRGKTVLN